VTGGEKGPQAGLLEEAEVQMKTLKPSHLVRAATTTWTAVPGGAARWREVEGGGARRCPVRSAQS